MNTDTNTPTIVQKSAFEQLTDTSVANIHGYVTGSQFQGDGDIGKPIGGAGAIILGLGLLAGIYVLSQTL